MHSHAAAASDVGLHELEGTDAGFFYAGARGRHAVWNGRLFDFEVLLKRRIVNSVLTCLGLY